MGLWPDRCGDQGPAFQQRLWPDRCGNRCPDFQQHDFEQIRSSSKDSLFYYKIGGKILPSKIVVR